MNILFLLSTDSDFDIAPTSVTFANPITVETRTSVDITALIDNTIEDRETFNVSIDSVTAGVPINVNLGINTTQFEIINIDGEYNSN